MTTIHNLRPRVCVCVCVGGGVGTESAPECSEKSDCIALLLFLCSTSLCLLYWKATSGLSRRLMKTLLTCTNKYVVFMHVFVHVHVVVSCMYPLCKYVSAGVLVLLLRFTHGHSGVKQLFCTE